MIRYALVCESGHEFEGWFGVSGDFDDQAARGLLVCPICARPEVRKGMMSPAVAGTRHGSGMPAVVRQAMTEIRRHVEENFDYVGPRFAKEARAIHDGAAEKRGIYGEASPAEVKSLVADGVPVSPLPPEPPKKSDVN